MHYGCVVVYEDGPNGEGRNFRDEYAPEGVRNRGIDANEGEGGIVRRVFVELDMKALQCGY